MIKILLLCSAGMSTSILCEKIKEAAKEKGVEVSVWATSEANARDHVEQADVVLLGPQVRFLEGRIKDMVDNKKPVQAIDMIAYGIMDGKKVLEDVLTLFK